MNINIPMNTHKQAHEHTHTIMDVHAQTHTQTLRQDLANTAAWTHKQISEYCDEKYQRYSITMTV